MLNASSGCINPQNYRVSRWKERTSTYFPLRLKNLHLFSSQSNILNRGSPASLPPPPPNANLPSPKSLLWLIAIFPECFLALLVSLPFRLSCLLLSPLLLASCLYSLVSSSSISLLSLLSSLLHVALSPGFALASLPVHLFPSRFFFLLLPRPDW